MAKPNIIPPEVARRVCQSHTDEWHAERLLGIGASESPAIVLGRHYGRSPMSLWMEKTGREEPERGGTFLRLGLALEPVVREQWMRETERFAEPCGALYRSVEFPWLQATPDFFWMDEASELVGPFQAKTAGNLGRWDEGIPEAVAIQLQHEMAVLGTPRASAGVIGAAGGAVLDFRWADLERDDEFITGTLLPKLAEFWKCVEDEEPPPADDTEETARALARIYAKTGEAARAIKVPLQVDGEALAAVDAFEELDDLDGQIKDLERRKTAILNAAKAEMKEAEIAVLSNGNQFTWKTQNRKSYVVKASTTRVFRRKRIKR